LGVKALPVALSLLVALWVRAKARRWNGCGRSSQQPYCTVRLTTPELVAWYVGFEMGGEELDPTPPPQPLAIDEAAARAIARQTTNQTPPLAILLLANNIGKRRIGKTISAGATPGRVSLKTMVI